MGILHSHKKRSSSDGCRSMVAFLTGKGALPAGYTRLIDCPEVQACVNAFADPISSATLYLMAADSKGDKRLKNTLSRFVDIDPMPGLGTGQSFRDWIVTTMMTEGDGNAFVLPHTKNGEFSSLEPMPDAVIQADPEHSGYSVQWRGQTFAPDEILHFRLHADLREPWRGRGYRVSAQRVAQSLAATDALKESLSSPNYKPPLLISVNSDSPLSDENARDDFRNAYISEKDGRPWVIPADLMTVETIKPLSLSDMAVKDTVELDKKTVASIFGVPPFLLGVGGFNAQEYNLFVSTRIIPVAAAIERELTLKLLMSNNLYFQFNRRRLFAYDLKTLLDIDLAMVDRGLLTGDEARETALRDPAGLTDFRPLENYIPYDLAGAQKKLNQSDDREENDDE